MLVGVMPSHDEHGFPLQGHRAAKSGQPIAGEFKFLLTQVVGDWDWLREAFWLQDNELRNDHFCFLCRATKSLGATCAWMYTLNPGWLASMNTHAMFMVGRENNLHCSFPGFDLHAIRLDLMHIVSLGIYHWMCGSAFWELVLQGRWGTDATPWKRCRGVQLRAVTRSFRVWARAGHHHHSHPKCPLSSLVMSTLQSRPYLHGQAANLNIVAQWLAEVTLEYSGRGDPHHDLRANALWGFTHAIRQLQQWPMILSLRQCAQLEECRRSALLCYGALSATFADAGVNLWVTKPKWHLFHHCLRLACKERLNPMFWSCYSDESFIGSIGRLARSRHNGLSLELGVVKKWLLQRALHLGDDA